MRTICLHGTAAIAFTTVLAGCFSLWTEMEIVGLVGGYGAEVEVPRQQSSRLRFHSAGSRLRVVFNGKELRAVDESTFAGLARLDCGPRPTASLFLMISDTAR